MHQLRERRQARSRFDAGRGPLEHAAEAVEPVVPVVVAGNAEQNPAPPVVRELLQRLIPGDDHAIQDLLRGRHRVRRVTAEEQDVTARSGQTVAGPIRIGELVGGEDQARHRPADRHVVTRIGHEVDIEVPTERFDQRRPAGVAPDAPAERLHDARREHIGRIGLHPVARVDVLGGDPGGDQVAQMSPERAGAEPDDTARPLFSPGETSDHVGRDRTWARELHHRWGCAKAIPRRRRDDRGATPMKLSRMGAAVTAPCSRLRSRSAATSRDP